MWELLEKLTLFWGGLDILRRVLKTISQVRPRMALEDVTRALDMKLEFENKLQPRPAGTSNYGRVIIRDIDHSDSYPNATEGRFRNISSWFRVDLKGLYHNGIEVYCDSVRELAYNIAGRTWVDSSELDSGAFVRAELVGLISFEKIVAVDWNGDNYYDEPHIFCRFDGLRNSPYEDYLYYYRRKDVDMLWPIDNYKPWAKYDTWWWRLYYWCKRKLT